MVRDDKLRRIPSLAGRIKEGDVTIAIPTHRLGGKMETVLGAGMVAMIRLDTTGYVKLLPLCIRIRRNGPNV